MSKNKKAAKPATGTINQKPPAVDAKSGDSTNTTAAPIGAEQAGAAESAAAPALSEAFDELLQRIRALGVLQVSVVEAARGKADLSAAAWNQLPDDDRYALMADVVTALETEKAGSVTDEESDDVMLIGSSVQPSILMIGGRDVQLGEIVTRAQEATIFTPEEWNALPDSQREAAIVDMIEQMEAEAAEAAANPIYIACWPLKFGHKKVPTGGHVPPLSARETASLLKLKAIQLEP